MLSEEEKGTEEGRRNRWERKRENQLLAEQVLCLLPRGPMDLPQLAGVSTPCNSHVSGNLLLIFSPNHFTKTGSGSDVAPGLPFVDPLPWGRQDKPQTHTLCPGALSGEGAGPVGKGPYIKAIRI